jgi:ATP-dependent DNA helicase DinG
MDVLGPSSPLAKLLAGYEAREGQLAMAEAVEDALLHDRSLFVEAGTGTGKTLAYLVPAVLSGKKVIVSTATLTLQEQIWNNDLPLVKKLLEPLGVTFEAALMKGLSNYLCKRRLDEASMELPDVRIGAIRKWSATSPAGDRAELTDFSDDDLQVWARVMSSPDTRIGAQCRHFEECFVTQMKRRAEKAKIIVVNHHLFCADLALRQSAMGASVLPPHDAIVFDEAHQLEEVATEFFGIRVSTAKIDSIVRDAFRSYAAAGKAGDPHVQRMLDQIEMSGRAFFGALAMNVPLEPGARKMLHQGVWNREIEAALGKLDAALEALAKHAEAIGKDEAVDLAGLRAARLRWELGEIADGSRKREPPITQDDFPVDELPRALPSVAWIEMRERSIAIGASRVDLGRELDALVWRRVPSVVCTSATLVTSNAQGANSTPTAAAPSFQYVRKRLGAPEHTGELWVPSPFDFENRAGLFIPRDLPDPGDPRFDVAASERIIELIDLVGGGAFVLTTSTRAMQRFHSELSAGHHHVLVQSEAPKHVLLDRFRAHGDAVLVATMSFWEGVDVPGPALRLVILDRIPFAVPTDPVVMARCESIQRANGNPFAEYTVPSAAILLKQGFGRLIRNTSDAGIVAILDRRLLTKSYGRTLLSSLPPAKRLHAMADVRSFWQSICDKPSSK